MNENKGPAIRILIADNYEIPFVGGAEPLDFLSKEGIAAFAAASGGENMRHYCEYLKARGYCGDAYADFLDRDNAKERVRWAISACRKVVKSESDFRAYMRNPEKPLADTNRAVAITDFGITRQA